jgi:carboxylesterase
MHTLGRVLNDKGNTCHTPIYEGHGVSPGQLIYTRPKEWWESAEKAYSFETFTER